VGREIERGDGDWGRSRGDRLGMGGGSGFARDCSRVFTMVGRGVTRTSERGCLRPAAPADSWSHASLTCSEDHKVRKNLKQWTAGVKSGGKILLCHG
jgi:hypothetical protein